MKNLVCYVSGKPINREVSHLKSRTGIFSTELIKEFHFKKISGIFFRLDPSEITSCRQVLALPKHNVPLG